MAAILFCLQMCDPHLQEFAVHVTEEFMEHCAEGALSIEVWGHHSQGFSNLSGWEMDQVHAKSRSIMDRWGQQTLTLNSLAPGRF